LTKFDLIVTLGAIEPHPLLGFSGGLKMVVPGCAGAETIGRTHLLSTVGDRFNYVGAPTDDSPMRLDLEEAGQMLRREVFIVNGVLNPEAKIVRFFCGDPRDAFQAGVDFLRQHTEITPAKQADVVITNSRPFDADLRQGLKCFGNTLHAARPGGALLGFLYCQQARGDLPLPRRTLPYPLLRTLLRIPGQQRIIRLLHWFQRDQPIEDQFLGHFGLRLLQRNDLWFYSDKLEPSIGNKTGVLRQYDSIERMIAAAVRNFGPQATVAVFPSGGVTYTPGCTKGSPATLAPAANPDFRTRSSFPADST
jgi:hypothetical protein